jgi:enoyl-CoA hydratase
MNEFLPHTSIGDAARETAADPRSTMTSDDLVLFDKPRPHVTRITLNKPGRLNSMSFGLVEALYGVIEEVKGDNDTWVVVLTGAGRGFCSGLDLHDRGMPPNIEGLGFSRLAMRSMSYMGGVVPALRELPQPVVAAINGPAIGGGLCLALGADIRFAGESAFFANAGITNGLTGSELGITYLLPRSIGTANAAEILLTGRQFDADDALRVGLVSRVLPDDQLVGYAIDTAEEMCELSPFGLQMTKQCMWANIEISSLQAAIDFENRNQLLAGYTGNLDEAIAAWREKRKPVYEE